MLADHCVWHTTVASCAALCQLPGEAATALCQLPDEAGQKAKFDKASNQLSRRASVVIQGALSADECIDVPLNCTMLVLTALLCLSPCCLCLQSASEVGLVVVAA